jgi:hypothetical protein
MLMLVVAIKFITHYVILVLRVIMLSVVMLSAFMLNVTQ